jgi:hypothetical protein
MTRKADIFDVWGAPPQALTKGLTKQQIRLLKRYADAVTSHCYRLAFDNGFSAGLTKVSSVANDLLTKQRNKMLRS